MIPAVNRQAVTLLSKAPIERVGWQAEAARSLQWHKVATAVLRHSWSSLVVVPAGRQPSSLQAVTALTQAVRVHLTSPVVLLDASGVTPMTLGPMLAQVNAPGSDTLIVSVDSFFENPAAIPLAVAAQAVLLCVTLGETDVDSANETLDLVREKVIGCVALRPRVKR